MIVWLTGLVSGLHCVSSCVVMKWSCTSVDKFCLYRVCFRLKLGFQGVNRSGVASRSPEAGVVIEHQWIQVGGPINEGFID